MSESLPPSEPSEPSRDADKRPGLVRLVPSGRGARWAVAGAAVVLVGGAGVTAVAVAGHHDRHERAARFTWSEAGHHQVGPKGPRGPEGPGERHVRRLDGAPNAAKAPKPLKAPVPVPSLPIGQAAEKASAAIPGGKVESLRTIAQDGGGSAWLAVVVAQDGVRHALTLSGTDGTITSNTPVNPRHAAAAGR
ncbi:hypothetical protein [Streptomyces sp. RerS4]|uniref:hypothetical protein n=1 Tax=Streptomyces sp. RerS4 TaxID=2942449 RepID=UPI00201C1CF7|nr:hypothetical protein [Streptomyces sp. RerS4]UQX04250.1 hypothetical protein M4D82_29915 [Streptomyces sp. RerS4]